MTKFDALQELENFYDALKPALEKSKEAFAWFSGIPHPLFNAVMHLKSDKNLGEKVDALIAKGPSDVPLTFWVHNQNGSTTLIETLKQRGFQPIITCPLMTWTVKPVALLKDKIETAKSANLEIFYDILATTCQWDEIVKARYAELLKKGAEIENYLIYLEGKPVGTGTIIPNGKIGGIFNLVVLPEYHKRGCGRAMMQFLMNRASKLELEKVVLLSSPIAEKLYSDLEFTKCFDIDIYVGSTRKGSSADSFQSYKDGPPTT